MTKLERRLVKAGFVFQNLVCGDEIWTRTRRGETNFIYVNVEGPEPVIVSGAEFLEGK